MKKIVQNFFRGALTGISALLVFSFTAGSPLYAQVASTYTFSQAVGAPTYLSAGYTSHTTGTTDEGVYNAIPIGFTFMFNCQTFTSVGISLNGYIVLGGSATTYYYSPISGTTSSNVISALGGDLQGLTTATLRSQTLGSAPNRTFVVEWRHFEKHSGADDYSFQIILFETSNNIQIKYAAATTVASNTFQVGLRGSTNTDFHNRTKAKTTDWLSSTAGALNTDVMATGSNAARNPQGTFTWTNTAVLCTGTPPTGTATAAPAAVCLGSPTTLSLTGVNGCGFSYQWQSSAALAGPYTDITGANTAIYNAIPAAATYYRCVVTCVTSGLSSTSSVVGVTMNPPTSCYCASNATSTTDEDIFNVTFGTLNNNSTCATTGVGASILNEYSDYTNIAAPSVMQGSTVSFSVQVGTCGGTYSNGVGIWIDYNKDGDFNDAGEKVYASATTTSGAHTEAGTIVIPLSALTGTTRMRVICQDSVPANPCGTYSYGETEDYLVNITAPPACTGTPVGGSTSAATLAGCTGYAGAISVTGSSVASGLTYQWYSSPTGAAPWTPIPGATGATYTPTVYGLYYRREITCIASGLSANSSSLLYNSAAPINDECVNATNINPNANSTCTTFVSGTVACASASSQPSGCSGTADDDVWYKFTATSTSHNVSLTNIAGSTDDMYFAVYSGSCGALTNIKCIDVDETTLSGLTIGATYYIRVYTYTSTAGQTSTFDLCVGTIPPPPPCASNPAAGDYCSTAVAICNLNGYCGNTSATYTATVSATNSTDEDDSALGDVFCGTIENNSWLSFVADATTATLNVYVSNCTNGWGIQMQVFSSTDCLNYTSFSNCWNPGIEVNGTVTATGLTIGQTYYLMIDGNAGDVCDYVISAASGVWTLDAGSDATICGGNSTTLNGTGASAYTWSPTTGLSNPNIANPVASPTTTTTYTLTGTGGNPLCPGTNTDAVTVTVSGITPTATSNSPICAGASLNLSSTPNAATSYSWSGPNGFTSTLQNPVIASATTAATGTYTVTVNSAGCTGTATVNVSVNSSASVTASSNSPVCTGSTLNLTSLPAGGTAYSWSGPNAFSATTQNPSIPSVTAAATGTYTVTATIAGGCTGSATVTIAVNPTPTATAETAQTWCNGVNVAANPLAGTPAGVTFNWSNTNGAIGLGTSGTGVTAIPSFTASNTTTAPISGTISITPVANGCTGSPINYIITVNPTPVATAEAAQTWCPGVAVAANPLAGTPTGVTFNWSNTNGAIGLGTSGTGVAAIPSFTATNTTTAPITGTVSITPLANGCTGTPINYTITVNPTPVATAEAAQTWCNGVNVAANPLAGTPTGVTFNWSNTNGAIGLGTSGTGVTAIPSFIATNTTTAPITGTVSIIPLANGCTGTTINYVITVNPTDNPAFNYTPSTLCITGTDTPATITGGATGTFTSTPAGLIITNAATGMIDVSASSIGDYVVTFTTSGTCSASSSTTVSITNAPVATINYAGPYCLYDTDPLPSFGPGASAGVFSSAAGLSINASTGVVDLSASTPGTYTITNTIAASGGCAAASDDATIVINPTPTVTVPADFAVCNGASVPAAILTGTPAGVSYTWTNSNSSIGLFAAGGGAPLGFTATNSGTSPVSGAVTIVPTANGCQGTSQTYTITVNPTPVADVPVSVSVCNGATVAALTPTGTPAGVTYAWTNSNTSIGLAASGSGTVPSFTASNSTSSNATATISITPSANGCTGSPVNYTITVYPIPTATAPSSVSYCSGSTVPQEVLSGSPAGALFSWANSNTAIGLSASGSGNVPSFTSANTSSGNISGTITVTPSANGCTGTPVNYTITVYPVPTVSVPANAAYCTGATVPSGVLTGNPAGVSFAWTNSNTSMGLAASGTGNIPGFTAVNTGSTPVSGTITVTPTANGCTGNAVTYTITVNPLPSLTFPPLSALCVGSSSLNLNMATPAGGTYSGTGVSGSSFNPATSGAGTFTLTYAYTDGNGCSNTTTQNITVNASPTANFTISPTVGCVGVPVTATYTGNGGAGASFAWGFNGGSANPGTGAGPQSISWTSAGTYTVSLTVTENGCPSIQYTQNVTIGQVLATGQLTQHVSCNGLGDGAATVSVSGGAQPYDYNWNSNPVQSTASATNLVPGTYVVLVTDDAGCTASSSVTITEPTALLADITDSLMVACYGLQTGMAKVTASGGTLPYSYAWASSSSTTSQVSNYPAGSYSVTVTDDNGCEVIVPFTITQNPQLSLDLLPTDEGCENSCSGYILTQVNGGLGPYTYSWNNASTADSLVNLCPGNYSLSVSDAAGCVVTGSTSILTNTYLSATADVSPLMGIAPSEISFTYTGTGGTLFEWDFGDGSTSTSMNPVHTYSAEGVYTVTLIVNSGNPDHCEEVFTIEITIYPPSSIEIPNVYTPNGDGFNDAFLVKSVGLDRESMLIFNRWGRKVAEWSELHGQWDGRMDGGAEAATGEYFYIFDAAGYDGKEYKINGTVTLLR